jgi:hypothetical protein
MRLTPMSRAGSAALLLLGLASCQMGPTLAQRLQAYIGQPEQAIVQGLGVPARTITTGGITYLAYVWQNTQVIPGSPGPWGPWGGGPWGPWGGGFYDPPTVVVTGCEATFQMGPSGQPGGGDVAVSVILRGNGCQ